MAFEHLLSTEEQLKDLEQMKEDLDKLKEEKTLMEKQMTDMEASFIEKERQLEESTYQIPKDSKSYKDLKEVESIVHEIIMKELKDPGFLKDVKRIGTIEELLKTVKTYMGTKVQFVSLDFFKYKTTSN